MSEQDKKPIQLPEPKQSPWRLVLIALGIITLFVPIDFVPDVLPLIGWLDDLTAVIFLVVEALKTIKNLRQR